MRIIDGDARMACLRERREVVDAAWECWPLHPLKMIGLMVRARRLERQYAAIMRGIVPEKTL